MEYQIVTSKFGKDHVYVPSEKMLYVSKGRENEYICYQTILTDKKKKDHEKHLSCSARIRCLPNGKCERQNVFIQHTAHPNHERIVTDKQLMNEVLRKAENLRLDFPQDAHRVPNRHIFQRELARYFKLHVVRPLHIIHLFIRDSFFSYLFVCLFIRSSCFRN